MLVMSAECRVAVEMTGSEGSAGASPVKAHLSLRAPRSCSRRWRRPHRTRTVILSVVALGYQQPGGDLCLRGHLSALHVPAWAKLPGPRRRPMAMRGFDR